jgi:RNA helicase./Putative viral replication protein.
MARTKSHRKYQLTINNPTDYGYSHESIKDKLSTLTLEYWCMCDEVGEEGTPHTHVYLASKNAIEFTAIKQRFYEAHIEPANGTSSQNRDYIRKEGNHADKKETNLTDTFEEWGDLPADSKKRNISEQIYNMIKDGKSNSEILDVFPQAYTRIPHIEKTRQILLNEKAKNEWRILQIHYIYGDTGTGKTRHVMEKHGYSNVYKVTNYDHPFDNYNGQDVILFDEFRSHLRISDMLVYLDGYPLALPCRYADKQALYTKVYIISNIPFNKQYEHVQQTEPKTWQAFIRRFKDEQKNKYNIKEFSTENLNKKNKNNKKSTNNKNLVTEFIGEVDFFEDIE